MPFIAAASRRVQVEDAAWIRTLDAFRVPFLLYGRDGHRDPMSPGAVAVFTEPATARSLLATADRMAADAIARREPRLHIGPFLLVQEAELPSAGVVLGLYLLGADAAPWHAAVIASPRPNCDVAAIEALSRRENEVARLIGVGLSTKEIAQRLGISPHTARHHTERIFARLGVTTRASVAAIVGEWRAQSVEPRQAIV